MKRVLVVVASMAMLVGLLAPTGAAAKTRSHRTTTTTNPIITGATTEIQGVLDTAVACVRAAVGDGGQAPATAAAAAANPAVIACIRTALRSVRMIVNGAIDDLQSSMGTLTPQAVAAFAQIRASVAAAFDRIDAQLAAMPA